MPAGYAPGLSVPARYPQRYRDLLDAAAARYRVPARVLAAQEFVESGYARDVIAGQRRSSTGAFGISQFMPDTARGYGVRPGLSRAAVRSQVFGHAHYLSDLGAGRDLRHAIASYAGGPGNPQYGYAAEVLGLSRSYRGIGRGGASSAGGGGAAGTPGTPATSARSEQGAGGTALAELTAKALQRQQGPPSFSLPAPPVHTAHVVLPEGQAANPPQSGLVTPQTAGPSVTDLLAAARQDANVQDARSTVTPGTPGIPAAGGGGSFGGGGVRGRVRVAAGANRAGVGIRPIVTNFLSRAAGIAGIPITITTGTNHNRMTTTGNVSDHWDGHAGDIAVPVDSAKGNRIAAAALIAAGVPRGRAVQMARHGGAFTVNHGGHRIQVLWKTYVGGNHHNHVHVGIR